MKTAIIYYSGHHGNTKKLLDAIAEHYDVTLMNAAEVQTADLSGYDLIGFASGIYYSKFHRSVLRFAESQLPEGKRVFLLYTYSAGRSGYTKAIEDIVARRSGTVAGTFRSPGFNTYGPFKLVGGIAKGHPD